MRNLASCGEKHRATQDLVHAQQPVDGAGQTDGWWRMSAPKIQEAVTFAGREHRLMSFRSPVDFVLDAAGAFVDVITPPSASQTSYSDHP